MIVSVILGQQQSVVCTKKEFSIFLSQGTEQLVYMLFVAVEVTVIYSCTEGLGGGRSS